MIPFKNSHLKKLFQKNIVGKLSQFAIQKNFTMYQKYINKSNQLGENILKKIDDKNQTFEGNVEENLMDKFSVEFSKTVSELKEELHGPHIQHKNFNKIYSCILEIIKTFNVKKDKESYDLIFKEILPFLEIHIQRFKSVQMIKIVCALAENNIGHLQYFRIFQYHIGKALEREKNHMSLQKEDIATTKMIYQYFSINAEMSMMETVSLNFVLDYFANYSNTLISKNAEPQTLYDFIWLTSISIASILVKNKTCSDFEPYVDKKLKVLQEKGALGLKKILNCLDLIVKNDNNFSENLVGKVRLYKALYYLKLEGLELPKNLGEYLIKFAPFHKMNMERAITSSALENSFEIILKKLGLKYEKEKKLGFCSVDFFIEPDYCIEINGPSHYVFTNRPKDQAAEQLEVYDFPVGKDLLKKRVLQLEKYDYLEFSYNELINDPSAVVETLNSRYAHLKDDKFRNDLDVLREERQIFISEKKQEADKKTIIQRVKDSHYLL